MLDPEYQHLVARSSLGNNYTYTPYHALDAIVNDYIFQVWEFQQLALQEADALLARFLIDQVEPLLGSVDQVISDAVFVMRKWRADIALISRLQDWEYNYQTLLKDCKNYIGTFASLPYFLEFYGEELSGEALMEAVDNPTLCWIVLKDKFVFAYTLLSDKEIRPYGVVDIDRTLYASYFSRLWSWRTRCARYWKILTSLGIVIVSIAFWWSMLIILPVVRWILAIARSQSQYLRILKQQLESWFDAYEHQYSKYTVLYDTMVDPNETTKRSVEAQWLMGRWFDVIPFAHHELTREASYMAKQLYAMTMSFGKDDSLLQTLALIDASAQWSDEYGLSLFVDKENHYPEQALYRLYSLLGYLRSRYTDNADYQRLYNEHYTSIREILTEKKRRYQLWTFRKSLWDGAIVAVSSGVLGRMGSYLWNWSPNSSSVLAAWPALLDVASQEHIESSLLSGSELFDNLTEVMTSDDVYQFFRSMKTNSSPTLWDTMVDQFWFTKGNIYTNHLMDTWWRISSDQAHSNLFELTIAQGDFPVSADDEAREELLRFLHRTYDYDSLRHYSELIDGDWLSNTLKWLKTAELSLADFSWLTQEQREIVTQALFYRLDASSLQTLFDVSLLETWEGGLTWSIIDTGTENLSGTEDIVSTWDAGVGESWTKPSRLVERITERSKVTLSWWKDKFADWWGTYESEIWSWDLTGGDVSQWFWTRLKNWFQFTKPNLSGDNIDFPSTWSSSGIVDDILSWMNENDLNNSAIDKAPSTSAQMKGLTVPVVKRDKKYK